MEEKNITTRIVIIATVIIIAGLVFLGIWNYNPYYNDTVYDYSDKSPRVGNNLYGFIDVPEGFVLKGSFDSMNEDYAGGKDGTPDGVRLIDPKGNVCITISIVTPDRKKADYIGTGFEDYMIYEKKRRKVTPESLNEDIWNMIETPEGFVEMENGAIGQGRLVNINGLMGENESWYTDISGKTFHNQMYYIQDAYCKNMIHCICFTYAKGSEEYSDYINTFSLTKLIPEKETLINSGKREGNAKTGYISLPKGYKKVEAAAIWKLISKVGDGVTDNKMGEANEFSCFVEKNDEVLSNILFECRLEKNEEFIRNEKAYMKNNMTEVFGTFDLLDLIDSGDAKTAQSNINIQVDESYKEFNAENFEHIMRLNLESHGSYQSEPVTIDGNKGYRITWNGRVPYTDMVKDCLCYIIEDDNNPDYVYVIGAKSNSNVEGFETFLKSFSFEN